MFGTFFLVAGIAPFLGITYDKKMGKDLILHWKAGTTILMIIYAITRVPNPITGGRALSINEIGIATEL